MSGPIRLTKADARRAMAAHHFTPAESIAEVFDRLRSIQFDPIAPVGCSHDLVLQSRVPGYKIGDWQQAAYGERIVYDGWDKQACLIQLSGWPVRRIHHLWHQPSYEKFVKEHPEAVRAVLQELQDRGPLIPKEFEFQQHKEEWRDSWYGPSVTKRVLRVLWNQGEVITHSRRGTNHVYELTSRVLPPELLNHPPIGYDDSVKEIILDRHRAMGLLRPTAQFEVWSIQPQHYKRPKMIAELLEAGKLVPVEVDGMKMHAVPEFFQVLDAPPIEKKIRFIAPLDQFMWDRKSINHIFGFEYTWEIYVPEAKRRWGYYVLPVLYGDELVGRAEFWARKGELEMRVWHWELGQPQWPEFFDAFAEAVSSFMHYCSAKKCNAAPGVDKKIAAVLKKAKPAQ